ncbi:ferric-dicitrate binding protein FerR (iron transport regulator) [Algoriphagus sp. 4150]|uniref:FecR family protein n=1 Tax=Algoriphagus sp. 4150 TaxID=2817756 RepID=UPI00285DC2FC|nr:FecR domain-containing protein [Algoriphagus sp. 4150]MDR7128873.1 ferric-dicitrate binding protein FerR (iron transport regulator) [Algoriphagus sp. 4150]
MSQINDLLEDLEFVRWVKYPDNELTTFWKSWIDANPDRIEDVKLAKEIVVGFHFPAPKATEATKKEVLTRILRSSKDLTGPSSYRIPLHPQINKSRIRQFPRVAAILIGAILLSLIMINLKKDQNPALEHTVAHWVTKETNAGEKLSFRLPDQTIVWLNAGSSLSFPESFDSTVRLVKLRGEGFFEVSENTLQPFQVLSDSLITTALGTSFNINARGKDEVKVSLVTGKVSVSYQSVDKDYFLTPGEELNYSKTANKGDVNPFNDELVLGWRFGKLIFKKSSLKDVKEKLEEWYGVEVSISGAPKSHWRFNGIFENQTLENVLKSMSNIENFHYKIENKKVSIVFNP